MWIGTQNGLNCYDGTRIISYGRMQFGTGSDFVNSLYEDSEGNILIGTDDGLVIYDYATDAFLRLSSGPSERIYAITSDKLDGTVLIGSKDEGLFIYHPAEKHIESKPLIDENGERISSVYRIATSDDGIIWIASYYGNIFEIKEGESRARLLETTESNMFENDDVEGLCQSAVDKDILYIASKRFGLCSYSISKKNVTIEAPTPEGSRPTGLLCAGDEIWMPSSHGMLHYCISTGSTEVFRHIPGDNYSLSANHLYGVYADDDCLWIGTEHQGVSFWESRQELFQNISDFQLRSFTEDSKGRLYIANESEGLLALDPLSSSLKNTSIKEALNVVYADGNTIWAGGNNGIWAVDTETGHTKKHLLPNSTDEFTDNRILSFIKTSDGKLFSGTSVGVLMYVKESDSFVTLAELGNSAIESFAEDKDGTLWVGTYHEGVYTFDLEKMQVKAHYSAKTGKSALPEMISSIYAAPSGEIWVVSFSSGIFRYIKESDDFEHFNKSSTPTLPTDIFYNALQDSEGNLWMPSDVGLVCFNPSDKSCKVYDSKDGLSQSKLQKACAVISGNRIAISSSAGIIAFDPKTLIRNTAQSGTMIRSMTVGDKQIQLDRNIDILDKVTLKYNQNSFGFLLANPGEASAPRSRILCKLDGVDENWRDVSSSGSIYYYNVKKGNYTFQLQGHAPVKITVNPRFWESTWGILLIVFTVLLIIAATLWLVLLATKKSERKKREQFLHIQRSKAIAQRIELLSDISDEIKTPVTLIVNSLAQVSEGKATEDDISIIDRSARHLVKMVDELSDYIKVGENEIIISRREINVADRLKFLCSTYSDYLADNDLSLNIDISEKNLIFPLDAKMFDRIFQTLFGFLLKHTERSVSVSCDVSKEKLTISIQGDGIPLSDNVKESIFTPFARYNAGMGPSLAALLAETMNGKVELSDMKSPGFNLTFFRMPLAKQLKDDSLNGQSVELKSSNPIVLLVEENKDLLKLMKKSFKTEFGVIATSSGEDAITMLLTYHPDIAIVDLALPGMSGMELCRRFSKMDNPFPTIILSSISGKDVSLKCMEVGASMIIEKPFSMEYLIGSVRATLERNCNLKQKYGTTAGAMSTTLELTNRDERFVEKLNSLLDENIGNADFSVQDIEINLNMSRSTLSRKVKLLFGFTPAEYMKNYRLDAAAQALHKSKARVNEVCYSVGFNSPSYFAKCFKKRFGVLPAKYTKKLVFSDSQTDADSLPD